MKIQFLVLILLTLVFQRSTFAAPVPQDLAQGLQLREQHLNRLAFAWHLAMEQSAPQKSPDRILSLQKATKKQLPELLRRKGITDEKTIQNMVAEQMREVPAMMKSYSSSFADTWYFKRKDGTSLVTGAEQEGAYRSKYSQFYENDASLVINESDKIIAGNRIPLDNPRVYGCPGESTRYHIQPLKSLDVMPEHFVALLGLNPLAMYGAHWMVVSSSPASWVLASQVEQTNEPLTTIRLTLDKTHGNAPAVIKVHRGNMFLVCHVIGYQQYKGEWICNHVNFSVNLPGILTTTQTWALEGVTPSGDVSPRLPIGINVIDYRLLGPSPDLLVSSPSQAQWLRKKVTIYPWKKQLPSMTELENLHQHQYPGEASPDMGQAGAGGSLSASNTAASIMPFAGGVLCLVGGVWMFKQRRAN